MITDWMERAACQGISVNYFFDDYLEDERVAIEVTQMCRACPVRQICYNFGVKTKSTGIWGGRWLSNGKHLKNKELVMSEYFMKED